jgi:DNA-binding beta-propeller fold protein YncE
VSGPPDGYAIRQLHPPPVNAGEGSGAGSTPFKTAGLGAEDARLSPDGQTLWVVGSAGDSISAFTANGGNITELSTSPTGLPAGAAPFGIVVT